MNDRMQELVPPQVLAGLEQITMGASERLDKMNDKTLALVMKSAAAQYITLRDIMDGLLSGEGSELVDQLIAAAERSGSEVKNPVGAAIAQAAAQLTVSECALMHLVDYWTRRLDKDQESLYTDEDSAPDGQAGPVPDSGEPQAGGNDAPVE